MEPTVTLDAAPSQLDPANLGPVALPPESEMGWRETYDWSKVILLLGTPILTAVLLVVHLRLEGWHPELWVIAIGLHFLGQLSISAGYHRLYAHRSYKAHPAVQACFLFFAASAMQNSALKWCNDHRRHHVHTDEKEDPHPVTRGFFYVHMGWVMMVEKKRYRSNLVKDLMQNPLIQWQNRNYKKLFYFQVLVLPAAIGWLCGAPIGGVAVVGLLKTLAVLHSTFSVNSVAHMFGARPYAAGISARDNPLVGFVSCGEGYHNFHHVFPNDYRAGNRRRNLDAAKWVIWTLSQLGLAWDLRRAREADVARARATAVR
ncbi:MAG: acyl-CoA desaturase [Candidatus Sericytochromatia bacterium]|nr:acyl-CoA desaturase [Candidatus Sericytochromatia bacterium]